jgi:hypothetical protein
MVEGKIVQTPTKFSIEVPEVLDLGLVFKSTAIVTAVDALIERAGHVRKDATPSSPLGELSKVDDEIANSVDPDESA